MSIFRLKSKINDINRLRKILATVFEMGGGILLKKMRLKYLVPWTCKIHCFFKPRHPKNCLIQMKRNEPVISAEVLRKMLEKLGPTFVKLGQVLSLRADLVGEKISEELSKLQSDVTPFSWQEAQQILTKELGQKPERIFKKIEKKPIAAASLAQVHRAYLKDGTEVAIKIQRPHIRTIIEQDIQLLFYFAHLVERFLPELSPYQPVRVIKEFADWTLRELDFKAEGNNAERFRFVFKENPHVHIPLIFWDYTTSRILVMEFMHGVKANDIVGIKKLGINPKKIAFIGIDAIFQQILMDGFFHADPHPGNFFALKNNVLCLHDFGMVGYLTAEQRKELVSCFVAFVEKDIDHFFKHFMHLAILSDQSDVINFQKEVSNILSEFFFSPKQPSIAGLFFRIINRGAIYGIRFPADLALFGKVVITTEAMGLKLYPEFNFNKTLQPFIQKAYQFYLDPKRTLQNFKANVFDDLAFFETLPERTQKLLSRMESGDLSIKVDPSEWLELKKEFDRQNTVRILSVVLVAVLITTGILLHFEGVRTIANIPLSSLGIMASAILLVWLILKLRKGPKK